jgi:hypothetical protein
VDSSTPTLSLTGTIKAAGALLGMDSLRKIRNEALERELKRTMSTQLQAIYGDVLSEELPPRFHDLLRLLDQRLENS